MWSGRVEREREKERTQRETERDDTEKERETEPVARDDHILSSMYVVSRGTCPFTALRLGLTLFLVCSPSLLPSHAHTLSARIHSPAPSIVLVDGCAYLLIPSVPTLGFSGRTKACRSSAVCVSLGPDAVNVLEPGHYMEACLASPICAPLVSSSGF